MSGTRSEKDSFGPIDVPADRLWGAQTERSRRFFRISSERMPIAVVHLNRTILTGNTAFHDAFPDSAAADLIIDVWARLGELVKDENGEMVRVPRAGESAVRGSKRVRLQPVTLDGMTEPEWFVLVVERRAARRLTSDNVQQRFGLSPRQAAQKAMDQVSGPVIAIGLVLAAVFVPCAFITGITGQFFRQFALTIAVSTLISAFNSLTLSPALAALLLRSRAKGDFEPLPWFAFAPLGGWLGGVWYGLFPVAPGLGLVMTTTGGLMLASATFAAFAGVISDPIQRATGLHQRRLEKMVNALERQFFDPGAPGFAVHDHYVARLLDLFDLLGAAVRLAR